MKPLTPSSNSSVSGHRRRQVKSLSISSQYERDFTGTYMGRKIEIEGLSVPEALKDEVSPEAGQSKVGK